MDIVSDIPLASRLLGVRDAGFRPHRFCHRGPKGESRRRAQPPVKGMPGSILITGCSTGIGNAAAIDMRARGWRVFATARKPQDIDRLAAAGTTALYLDYAEPESIERAVEAVFAATGGTLDALFNNGAYAQPGALEDVSTEVLRAQFEANFFGWHELTRRVIPAMRREGQGRIVMCSSILGIVAMGFRGLLQHDEIRARSLFATRCGSSLRDRVSMSR